MNVLLIFVCNLFIHSSNANERDIDKDELITKKYEDITNKENINKNLNEDNVNKNNNNVSLKKSDESVKQEFSKKPSFLGFGFDPFTFLYNFLVNMKSLDNAKNNTFLDFRFKIDTDFDRLILALNCGILKWDIDNFVISGIDYSKSTFAFFVNPCLYYNFFKKNSWKNALYLGGGLNFGGTFYDEKDNGENENTEFNTFKNKSLWFWFNLELGNRIKLLSFLHINAHFRITFLNFKIIDETNKIKQNVAKVHNLYGYGYVNKSYNIEFCINFLFNINLFNDEKVTKRESYLQMY